ncbi:MORC family ATPase [Handroanthus impetiginosus]|uniref:MORC family ATPase n=1 Tax=Handroanthus impetiginosus TaxID=429701 RepID=A0A2G9HRV6_9LAMI|nr:MORC family ATPase [Handroanthus impetiginosus]
MSPTNLSSNHGLGELGVKAVKLEQDSVGRSLQQHEYPKFDLKSCEASSLIRRHETEQSRRSTILNTPSNGASILDQEHPPIDDSSFCSTSSICPAPICRQFWKAGNYDDKLISKPTSQTVAELLDNSVDEIQNGATFVIVDKTSDARDGTPALLIQDDGGGMDPEAMRRCLSFGFSDKKSKSAIGRYGNGFKTSSMRLGSDVVVFSRCTRDRKLTQSVGLLSYTFLMQTRQDRIVVPMVDYQFNEHDGTWNTLHAEEHLKNNLSILLQWSPFTTEAELMKQFDEIGPHGTKIIIYNLWHDDVGNLELDFESDHEDIQTSRKGYDTARISSRAEANEQHLANRLHYSLRAYLSILYLRVPQNFCILLRGRVVEYHSIANDLKFPEFILYRPQNVEGSVITTIGFLKEAPAVNIHGFNVYHKNRLILPFWHVVTYSCSRGRGVVGVLEANFIEPTHNKQDFEKTQIFQKLETRLKEMTQEYWDYHCGLIGYQVKIKPRPNMLPHAASDSGQGHSLYQPVVLGRGSSSAIGTKESSASVDSRHEVSAALNQKKAKSAISAPSFHRNAPGAPFKRKGHDDVLEPARVNKTRTDSAHGGYAQHAVDPEKQFEEQEAANLIEENQKLRAECQEYEKTDEELNFKITRLTAEIREARRQYTRLLLESKVLEKAIKQGNREPRPA